MPVLGRLGCLAVLSLALVLLHPAASQDYTADGPYGSSSASQPFQLPAATGCGRHCGLTVRLTVPVAPLASSAPAVAGPPYPLVAFLNGFQSRASFYTSYATRLASWGYAVLQYDTPLFSMADEATELTYLPLLLADLEAAAARAAAGGGSSDWERLAAQVDGRRLATAGHSRGGKLAALFYAGLAPGVPAVLTSVLVDPVDSSSFSPEGPRRPSAIRALAGRNKTAALIGAGVLGACNPVAGGASAFWRVLGAGSWQEVVWGGGHAQFADIPFPLRWAADKLCGAGANTSHEGVMELTAAPMAAWIDTAFKQQAQQQRRQGAARAGASSQLPAAAGRASPKPASPRPGAGSGCPPAPAAPGGSLKLLLQQPAGGCVRARVAPKAAGSTPPGGASLAPFFNWVEQQQEEGLIAFQVKA